MRVLHVDNAVEFRGGQQQLLYLLEARGDPWAGVPDSPLARRAGPPAVALFPGNDPRNPWRLRAAAADLLAAHTPHAHKAALFAGRPVVVHRRVDFAPRSRWAYRRAAAIVAVSRAVAEVLARAGIPGADVVHDGVRPRPPGRRIEASGPVWGAVGALVDHKGHTHLIEAMRGLPGTLLLAGEGPGRARLEAQARGLPVRFLGVVPAEDVFASVDVFVHPSVEEGMGQVLVEAMAAGCRIAATTAGGIPEVVGGVASLCPPGDPVALRAAMLAALARPPGEGLLRAADFSVERMVAGTEAVYRRVLTSASSG